MNGHKYLATAISLLILGGSTSASAEGQEMSIMQVVQKTLANHPNLVIGKQTVRATRGAVQASQGSFDWVLGGNASHSQSGNSGPLDVGTDSYDYGNQSSNSAFGANVSKVLPWGMSVSSGVNFTRSESEIDTELPDTSTVSSTPLVGTVSFTVTQPLLRGFGSVTTAEVDARKQELEAAKSEFKQSVIIQVRTAISAYWSYVSAYQYLKAAHDSESRAERLLKDNQKLVQADLRPAAELRQLEANYSDSKRGRYQAEQSVISARHSLGVAMGLDADAAQSIGKPKTAVPPPPTPGSVNLNAKEYIEAAFAKRSDLDALEFRTKAAKLRLASADNARLPNLDLVGTMQYAGLGGDDDYTQTSIATARTDLLGYTATLQLNFSWPPQNNAADGFLAQSVAQHRIAQESERSLKQQIGASVYSAVSDVEKKARIAYEGLEAERLYEESVQNEEKKLKAGLSTLINLVLTQERLAGARINAVSGLQAYAESLLAFRFATGTLFDGANAEATLNIKNVLSFPQEK